MLRRLAISLLAAQVAALRYAIYVDEWHIKDLPGREQTTGVTHAIMAFANSELFLNGSAYEPWEPLSVFRSRFPEDSKILIAIGGWGDTKGFSLAVQNEESMRNWARSVANMVNNLGVDGIDIDWEYPGGNGQDYMITSNEEKANEVDAFPVFLQTIREELGPEKLLSVAVPGLARDQIAFTAEKGPAIWESVDFVNIMTYDLMNRRDTETKHHTSVRDSLAGVKSYLDIGLTPDKANLGFAFYAKYFPTAGDCGAQVLGCPTEPMENADGSDNGKSGVITFERQFMAPPSSTLSVSSNGLCGPDSGKCPEGQCCSQYGYCGSTDEFCSAGCLSDYGTCRGISALDSWRKAQKNGITDEEAGGQYYWDPEAKLFWTWDTPELIARKFKDIVEPLGLGGVMAWSLGEDTYDWSHVKALSKGVTGASDGPDTSGASFAAASSADSSPAPSFAPNRCPLLRA